MREFAPLPADHPLIKEPDKNPCCGRCPVCRELWKEGDVIVLVSVQAHGPEGIQDLTVMSIPVHSECYWPKKKEG